MNSVLHRTHVQQLYANGDLQNRLPVTAAAYELQSQMA